MRANLRIVLPAAALFILAGTVAWWLLSADTKPGDAVGGNPPASAPTPKSTNTSTYPDPAFVTFPDPNARGTAARVFLDPVDFDSGVFGVAAQDTFRDVKDFASLAEYKKAIAGRVVRSRLRLDAQPATADPIASIGLCRDYAFVALYEGDHDLAKTWLMRGLAFAKRDGVPAEWRGQMVALLGLNALRRGEQDNCIACVGPSSCIFPISRAAVHTRPSGSREAVDWFTTYLDEWPGDLRIRWLLNIAYMTLGEYPDKVPPRYLIATNSSKAPLNIGKFENIATRVGLVARGPDLAGGCLFDDFTGDGRPDVLTTTFDVTHGASLYVNRGDGTFEDRSVAAGLDDQVYSLNATRADYDNDGDLDILMLRGAWEEPARMSLLRNNGSGVFEDVTLKSGLDDLIASESAAWGDFDNDGKLDVFVCGEYHAQPKREPDPRNLCRLYRNKGDGTFVDVAAEAGVLNERWAKGSAWGDFDNDGKLDLFVSNMGSPPRLYHNEGNGKFRDVAPALKIDGPPHGFACLFADYDNDGRPDIFVCDWGGSLAEFVASYMGLSPKSENHMRLYRNLGKDGFRDVTHEAGLDRPMPVMSVNIGDIDNDGDLDIHLGTGWMSLSGLIPDITYINDNGRFVDVTEPTTTGHLQKGHGVSFADWDDDGDLDLFVVLGGGYPGDRGYNALFQNPGNGKHWLKLKLVGSTSNRSAIGARIRVDWKQPGGAPRSAYRVIGDNGSFGGNSLVEFIGLGDAATVDRLSITWPTGGKAPQTFENIKADQSLEVTEGTTPYKILPRRPLPQPKP